ncbi:MAG: hypothetical protein RR393_05310 [Bacteroidales bacterium]
MIYIALPAMNEKELENSILNLQFQTLLPKAVYVCVNQPLAYFSDGDPAHGDICKVNRHALKQLQIWQQSQKLPFDLECIDRCSLENAWPKNRVGVGWARKTAMDAINQIASDKDIIVCMDADTYYPNTYLQNIQKIFASHPKVVGLANPYYHEIFSSPSYLKNSVNSMSCQELSPKVAEPPRTAPELAPELAEYSKFDENSPFGSPFKVQENSDTNPNSLQKTYLHYEVYMRAYAIQMYLSNHPYRFTAIGSCMASPVWAYRKINGITPCKSGEDFYFLQKLAKIGPLAVHSPSVAIPSARVSDRVFFGTGPALRKGLQGDWKSYPIYPWALFDAMQQSYNALGDFYENPTTTDFPLKTYWSEKFGDRWWEKLQQNSAGRKSQFIRLCIQKIDALRCLQYLKEHYAFDDFTDRVNLRNLCYLLAQKEQDRTEVAHPPSPPKELKREESSDRFPFLNTLSQKQKLSDLTALEWAEIRNFLFLCERRIQQNHPILPSW